MNVTEAIERAIDIAEEEGYQLERLIEGTDDRSPGSQKRVKAYVDVIKKLKGALDFAEKHSL